MSDFWLFFGLGKDHIADLNGYDHILFIIALCIRYTYADWKKVLLLVTAFTIGHSITLALSVISQLHYSVKWIEFLIPVSILITGLANTFERNFRFNTRFPLIYFLAMFFGLIHGLGFSSYLKSLLGKDANVVSQLLAFNLGLEAGQLMIVTAVLIVSLICIRYLKFQRREYVLFISGAVSGIALTMAIQRFPL